MIIEKDFAGRQTVGARASQEDAYAFSEITDAEGEKGLLVVVADGMGGHSAGELASEVALETFVATFHQTAGSNEHRLSKALGAANEAVANKAARHPSCDGMGTTLLATCITRAGAEWISVGDSSLYLWRDKHLQRLNADHSLRPVLRELAEQGHSTGEARASAGNILRAALTGNEIAMIDRSPEALPLQTGDVVLFCTDGIETLTEDNIAAVIAKFAETDAATIAQNVLHAVLQAGNPKQDNTTAAVVRVARPIP